MTVDVACAQVFKVGLVGAAGGAAAKLSSTELRAKEAATKEGRSKEETADSAGSELIKLQGTAGAA